MLITIDGPAGSGKSTAAKLLAKRFSVDSPFTFEYLDTGSMYRSIALLGYYQDIDWHSSDIDKKLTGLAESAQIDIKSGKTFLNGKDVTSLVRMPQVTQKTHFAADNPEIRSIMVEHQRKIAQQIQKTGRGVITEGRDQGTVVFPDALCKFFITASAEERAKRRCSEQEKNGITSDFQSVLQEIILRDKRDESRKTGPLREPEGAVRIITDTMGINDIADLLVKTALERINGNSKPE